MLNEPSVSDLSALGLMMLDIRGQLLWSDNVTTGSALLLQTPAQGNPVQLIGWDKLAA